MTGVGREGGKERASEIDRRKERKTERGRKKQREREGGRKQRGHGQRETDPEGSV